MRLCWESVNLPEFKLVTSLALTLLVVLISTQPIYGQVQQTPNCDVGKICVFPGAFLKYHTSNFGSNSTFTINFEGFVNADNIRVLTSTATDSDTVASDNILNLRNETLFSNDGTSGPFRYIAPTPINSQEIGQPGVKEEVVNFNGTDRMAWGYHFHNTTSSFDLDVDNQTGVLLNFDAINIQPLNQTASTGVSIQLLQTNMFVTNSNSNVSTSNSNVSTSNSNVSTSNSNVSIPATIPQWLKNVAGLWSKGEVSDGEFVQGMQYLIKQNILKVPPTSQAITPSGSIPQWIRHNASWWSSDQISDDEFLKGIQYLISNGIIEV